MPLFIRQCAHQFYTNKIYQYFRFSLSLFRNQFPIIAFSRRNKSLNIVKNSEF